MTVRMHILPLDPHSPRWYSDWKPPKIRHGRLTRWNWLVLHPENLQLGRFTDVGAFSLINAEFGVHIEDYVQIGSHVAIYSVSTIEHKHGPVRIGSGARIGTHSVIMPGVSIGENATVGAFSFVNRNIPARAVAYGIPAQVVSSK